MQPKQDLIQFSSVQLLSRVRLFATPWIAARKASLSSLRLTSIESVMPSSHLILCRPLLLLPPVPPSLRVFSNESTLCKHMDCSPSGFLVHHGPLELSKTHVHWVGDAIQPSHPLSSPSPALNLFQHQGLFQWVSSSHQVAKVLEFQLQHQSFNEHPGLVSFRMDWLDLLTVQGTLKSLFQHHSSKASILLPSAFFIVQLSHPYMTTGKTIALTRQPFVGKVMSLLFNTLSRLVITFLPRSVF